MKYAAGFHFENFQSVVENGKEVGVCPLTSLADSTGHAPMYRLKNLPTYSLNISEWVNNSI